MTQSPLANLPLLVHSRKPSLLRLCPVSIYSSITVAHALTTHTHTLSLSPSFPPSLIPSLNIGSLFLIQHDALLCSHF